MPVSERPHERTALYALALLLLSLLSRLPQLLGPRLFLDGDEATLGLMAKALAQGRELPVFFWGQRYGFSLIEAAAGALAFRVAGVSAFGLKLSMLGLWTAGLLCLFFALTRHMGARRGFWLAALLVLTPGWAVWSMKARGGYLTAFAAAAALVWLLVEEQRKPSAVKWLLAGVGTSVIYLAQPLWVPGVLPFLAVALFRRRRLLWTTGYVATMVATLLLARLAAAASAGAWAGPPFEVLSYVVAAREMAQQIFTTMTGSYYLWWAIEPPGIATTALAVCWYAAIPLTLALQAYRVVTRRFHPLSHLLFASLWCTLVAEWLLLGARDPRYMLPIVAPLVLLAGVEFADLVERRVLPSFVATVLTGVMLVAGAGSMMEFSRFSFLWPNPPGSMPEAARIRQVVKYLDAHDVRYAYATNGLLGWQLMFYGDAKLVARSFDPVDRRPEFPRAVDHALVSGEPVAIVGFTNASGAPGCGDPGCAGGIERLAPNPERLFIVDGKYFVYAGADRTLVEAMKFRVWE